MWIAPDWCTSKKVQPVDWRPRLGTKQTVGAQQQIEELVWWLSECYSGKEKSETNSPSACCSQADQQNWLDPFEASRKVFFKVIFFSFNSFFLSFLLFLLPSSLLPSFAFISLLPSFFFFVFNSHRWDNKNWTVKRPELDPKRGHPNSWDRETNFTLLFQKTCKLLYICIINFSLFLYLLFC